MRNGTTPDLILSPRIRASRWLLILLSLAAIIVGGHALLASLPFDYYPYFWDGAALLSDVTDPDFSKPGPLNANSYALRKYAYALPVHYAVRSLGFAGVLAVNLTWFIAMLAGGIWALDRVPRASPRFPWAGVLAFVAGMTAIPFVHKYIGMANPTIQAMALWFGLLLFYELRQFQHTTWRQGTILPGILAAGLVLTDFPKWALILVPTLVITEFIWCLNEERWLRRIARTVSRAALIMAWMVAGLLIPIFLVPNYFRNNIGVTLFGESAKVETIRPALSWNFLIFLWVLGGFFVLLFVVIFLGKFRDRSIRQSPAVVLALAVVGLFSLLIWPRSARMFAAVVPYALFLFGRMLQQVFDSLSTANSLSPNLLGGRAQSRWAVAGLVCGVMILGGLVARSPRAGSCFTVPTGVRKVNLYVANDPRLAADSLLGTYVQPLFQLSVPPRHKWHYVPGYMWSDMRWVCSGDFIDEVIIEEQFLHGRVPLSWRTRQDRMLGTFRGEPTVAQFPNDFYASKWYLVESNFDDGQLAFFLRRAAELTDPMWRLHFVAGLAGDTLIEPTQADTIGVVP